MNETKKDTFIAALIDLETYCAKTGTPFADALRKIECAPNERTYRNWKAQMQFAPVCQGFSSVTKTAV